MSKKAEADKEVGLSNILKSLKETEKVVLEVGPSSRDFGLAQNIYIEVSKLIKRLENLGV
jgi:hypothetical protein